MNKALVILFSMALLASTALSYADFGGSICNAMFQANPLSSVAASQSTLLSISLLIVLAVLSLLSIIYAIGRAFGIGKLISFVQREYLESIFNIILIALVAGGLGFADSSIRFFAYLSSLYLPSSSMPSIPQTANGLLLALCANYYNNGVYQLVRDFAYLLPDSIIANFLSSVSINFNAWAGPPGSPAKATTLHRLIPLPAGVSIGFSVTPLAGIYPYIAIINTEMDAAVTIVAVYLGVGMFLAVIAALFPLLFYLGILLRSFPWMRAAGGALISLFVSFYIVFPGIAYGISNIINPISGNPSQLGLLPSLNFGTPNAVLSIFTNIGSVVISNLMPQITNAIDVFIYSIIQLIGIGIAFLISFDLLELLGDLLGAPSLQSTKLLSKVI